MEETTLEETFNVGDTVVIQCKSRTSSWNRFMGAITKVHKSGYLTVDVPLQGKRAFAPVSLQKTPKIQPFPLMIIHNNSVIQENDAAQRPQPEPGTAEYREYLVNERIQLQDEMLRLRHVVQLLAEQLQMELNLDDI